MRVSTLIIAVTGLITTSSALPHEGMLETPGLNSIGVGYENANFEGKAVQFVRADGEDQCFPIEQYPYHHKRDESGTRIGSIKICKPITCTLFKSWGCRHRRWGFHPEDEQHRDGGHYAVRAEGPVDVKEIASPNGFRSYICGQAAQEVPTNETYTQHSPGGAPHVA